MPTKLYGPVGDTVSDEGTSFTLSNTVEAGLTDARIKGDISQATVSGKNKIYPTDLAQTTIGSVTCSVSDGLITFNGGPSSGAVVLTNDVLFNLSGMAGKPAISVIPVSGSWTAGAIGVRFYNSNNSQIFQQQERYDGVYFNYNTLTDAQIAQIDHARIFATNTGTFNNFQFKVMLTKSNTLETQYTDYVGGYDSPNPDYPQNVNVVTGTQTVTVLGAGGQSQSYTIDLDTIELCKIGDSQDYIYKIGDDWYIHKETNKVTLTGAEDWTEWQSTYYTTAITDYATIDNIPVSSYFIGTTNVSGSSGVQDNSICFINQSGGTTPRFYIRYPQKWATGQVTALKTWLGNNLPKVYYPLATAADTQISDAGLIAQLEAFRNLFTYEGNTSFTISGNLSATLYASALTNSNTNTKEIIKLYGSLNGQSKLITKLYGSVNGQTKRIL